VLYSARHFLTKAEKAELSCGADFSAKEEEQKIINKKKKLIMKNLTSLKNHQIQPIEKMSCIKGGTCTVTPRGKIMGFEYSADAETETGTTYHGYNVDGVENFQPCPPPTGKEV
jgi:hypothetical protein